MSEPTLPLPADLAEDVAPPTSRRRAVLAVGGLGVVALAALGMLVLTGPAEGDLELGLPAGNPAAAAPPSPTAGPAEQPVVTAQVQRGRDPFRAPAGATGTSSGVAPGATAPEPAEPAGGASGPGGAPAQAPGQDSGPPAVGEPVADGGEDGAADGGGDGVASTVTLVRVVGDQTAVLTVDGTSHTVRVGDGFGPAGSLLLLSLQEGPDDGQWTAVVQRESGDPFDVVSGSPATVA